MPNVERSLPLVSCQQQVSGHFARQGSLPSQATSQLMVAQASRSAASNGNVHRNLAELVHEYQSHVRFWCLRWVAPSANIPQGFARVVGFVPGRRLRSNPVKPSFSSAPASNPNPGPRSLEFLAMYPGPCHNNQLKRTRVSFAAAKPGW